MPEIKDTQEKEEGGRNPINPSIPSNIPVPNGNITPSSSNNTPLEPVDGKDFVGMVNQIAIFLAKTIDEFLRQNTRLLQMIPEKDRSNLLQGCNIVKQSMDVVEKVSRGIHKYPPFRNVCNDGLEFLLFHEDYKKRASYNAIYNKWCAECGIPQWTNDIRPKYKTMKDAVRNGLPEMHERCCEWIEQNTDLVEDSDVNEMAINFLGKFIRQTLEEVETNIFEILSRKPVPHPKLKEVENKDEIREITSRRVGKD